MPRQIGILGSFVLFLLLFCNALAADPIEDVIALVFDVEWLDSYSQDGAGIPVIAYIILYKPADVELYGFEVAVHAADGELFVFGSTVAEGGENSLGGQEFSVTYDSPVPTTAITVLGSITIFPVHFDECIVLTGVSSPAIESELPLIWTAPGLVRPIESNNIFANGVDAVVAGSSYPLPYAVHGVPCEQMVSVATVGWGSLKARYR